MHNILSAKNVKKFFFQGQTKLEVLKGVTATFEQGKSYGITGVSGTGKSTFMHILAGLDMPNSGEVHYNTNNLENFSEPERQRFLLKTLGLVFQLPYLIKELSVIENVMIKGLIEGRAIEECKEHARALLDFIGLGDKADSRPGSLSGGQQQRIAIIRAIFNKPQFLLADEPTGNVDVETGKTIVDLLKKCQAEWEMGIIVSSHDSYVVEAMETVLRLQDGVLGSQ